MDRFINEMKEGVKAYLPEDICSNIIIDDVVVVKMNDQKLHGLAFKMPGVDAAPTLYVNEMYEAYKNGADIEELAEQIANMYIASLDMPKPPVQEAPALSWDDVKGKLTIRLLEKKRNHEFLSTMPYVSVGNGLAVIADINMGEDRGGDWRIAVNNGVLEILGVDKERLLSDAMSNAKAYEPASLVDMSSALFSPEKVNLLERDEPIAPEDIGGMYVLTNSTGSLGAAALFYPDVKEKAAELLGGDYYILPSSVHEVILVPDTPDEETKKMLAEIDLLKQEAKRVSADAEFTAFKARIASALIGAECLEEVSCAIGELSSIAYVKSILDKLDEIEARLLSCKREERERSLREMVRTANRTVVEEHEVLSDNVYRYSNGELITVVDKAEATGTADAA